MKFAAAALLIASAVSGATAFAPAHVCKTGTATATELRGAFDSEIGAANSELGCWDPLGYVTNGDQKRFDHLRGVELKHGRIAMLATWGYATTWSGARFPGCEDFPAGDEAIFKIGAENLVPVLLTAGLLEFTWKQKAGSFPGDFSKYHRPKCYCTPNCEKTKNLIPLLYNNRCHQIPCRIWTICTFRS